MTAIKLDCCYLDDAGVGCDTVPEWAFHRNDTPPEMTNSACSDHLGHVLDLVPRSDGCLIEHNVWPLVAGYDASMSTHEELVAVGAIT